MVLTVIVGFGAQLAGCGADGDDPNHHDVPVPGYAGACSTPMAGVLGCPASPVIPPAATPEQACGKLVTCGILADQREVKSGDNWIHALDYRWCVNRLRDPGDRRCADGRYTLEEVDLAVRCILATPCATLGAILTQKLENRDKRPDIDEYRCADNTSIWTATVCDHGLLYYDYRQN